MVVWDGLDECEISRPEILFQSAPGYEAPSPGVLKSIPAEKQNKTKQNMNLMVIMGVVLVLMETVMVSTAM